MSIIHFTFSYFYIFIALNVIKMTTTSWRTGAGAGPSGDSNSNAQWDEKWKKVNEKIVEVIKYESILYLYSTI